jgi:hypothetical protein
MAKYLYAEDSGYFLHLAELLDSAKTQKQFYDLVVNTPFSDKMRSTLLGLGIVVLLLVDEKKGIIDRISLSDTYHAKGSVRMSVKRFREIKIPLENKMNIIAKAIRTDHPQITSDWQYLFTPDLDAEESRLNQASAGIGCSVVYSLKGIRNGGAMIFSYYLMINEITSDHHEFMNKYTALVSKIWRQKGFKYPDK